MSLLSVFLGEVRHIEEWLGVSAARPLPNEVVISDTPPSIHTTSSLTEDGVLLISRELMEYSDHLLRKEALSLFIPPEADEVPQVHDLAWVYSDIPKDVWRKVRAEPPHPFTNYDPMTLFSVLGRRGKDKVIRDLVLVLRASRRLPLDIYIATLNRFFEREFRLTEAERKLIRVISVNPYVSTREMKEAAKISEASISRSLRRLRRLGYIFGPENVVLGKLGLTTLVATFPNEKRLREAFWRFPFTYTQMIPVDSRGTVYAYLVFPVPGIKDLLRLEEAGVGFGLVKRTAQRFNFTPPRDVIREMAKAHIGGGYLVQSPPVEGSPSGVKLTKTDIEVLNHIMREGKVSSTQLSELGIRSAKLRLNKLRSAGIIGNYYMVGLPRGMETLLFVLDVPEEEVGRLASTLSAASSALVNYVEGSSSYCIAISMTPREIKSDIIKGMSLIYGDRLARFQEVFEILPQWYLPTHLWDERTQVFRWEEPIESLLAELK